LNSSRTKYKIPTITKDFLFVLGIWAAEGRYTNKGIGISQKEKYRNKIIERCLKKVFGNYSLNIDTYWAGGKTYSYLFKKLGMKSGSANKVVPSFVFSLPKQLKSEFIKGYFFGDGYINKNPNRKNPQLIAVSKSHLLITGLSYLLYSLGIENSVVDEYKSYNKERRKYYILRVKTGSLKTFIDNVGQIPTKEIYLSKSVSRIVPHYAKAHIYQPLLRLTNKELNYFQDILKDLKELYLHESSYMKKLIKIINSYPSKRDFCKKYNFYEGTIKDITCQYVKKSPHHFYVITKIIRENEKLRKIDINIRRLKKILRKLKIGTYLNNYSKITPAVIKNILFKTEKKIGDSLFILAKIIRNEIYLQRIYDISKIKGSHKVYDFSVEKNENFVGGNIPILLHNTVSDFLNSMISKRLTRQLKEIKKYKKEVFFANDFASAVKRINDIKNKDIVITMGAGDVWKVGEMVLGKN